jgi:hypothetical protein
MCDSTCVQLDLLIFYLEEDSIYSSCYIFLLYKLLFQPQVMSGCPSNLTFWSSSSCTILLQEHLFRRQGMHDSFNAQLNLFIF